MGWELKLVQIEGVEPTEAIWRFAHCYRPGEAAACPFLSLVCSLSARTD